MENKEIFLQSSDLEQGVFDFQQYRIGYLNAKNREKSAENEDSLFFYGDSEGVLLGVSDGVGGYPKGGDASEIVSRGMLSAIKRDGFDKIRFLEVLQSLNQEVRELKVGARTTHISVMIKHGDLNVYSIGDSEVLLCNTKGSLIYANVPQSPVGYGLQGGFIDQGDALDAPERNLVDHLLGDEILRFEASSKIPFKKGHTVLVGTDGLFDNLKRDDLLKIIGGGHFEEAYHALADFCVNRNLDQGWRKDDDISFLLLRRVRSD